MSDSPTVTRIKELEEAERRLENILAKGQELVDFIEDWDSEDTDRLPLEHKAKINSVRRFVSFCQIEKPEKGQNKS